ncbi:hypothetical protein T4D_239 [Trichinella pseudospiralis]|uniref:Uncharacterized protein n=1 Tax=Trichinella pseudospiralis TaxID=6337 RepID=A0A0V1FIK6_TRIPS|nr:hypothetical protein T4D_239 [Trichinella pseudospiralis]
MLRELMSSAWVGCYRLQLGHKSPYKTTQCINISVLTNISGYECKIFSKYFNIWQRCTRQIWFNGKLVFKIDKIYRYSMRAAQQLSIKMLPLFQGCKALRANQTMVGD